MKTDEVIELVSKSQDGDSLINRGGVMASPLSDFIVDTIISNSDGGEEVDPSDLDQLEGDLNYALNEITKARDMVIRIKERVDY